MQRHLELVFAGIDAGADHAMLAHLPRPFLVMRTHGSFNHPGPDEEPTAILLLSAALAASVGHDPTIGGPAPAATPAGPFLPERPTTSPRAHTKLGLRSPLPVFPAPCRHLRPLRPPPRHGGGESVVVVAVDVMGLHDPHEMHRIGAAGEAAVGVVDVAADRLGAGEPFRADPDRAGAMLRLRHAIRHRARFFAAA